MKRKDVRKLLVLSRYVIVLSVVLLMLVLSGCAKESAKPETASEKPASASEVKKNRLGGGFNRMQVLP